ncbi:MAG: hypothetical protein HY401_08195 [Elusimicrobia bacterium]|nr:hypothetical protein [Elusimicrobiota bacterium]
MTEEKITVSEDSDPATPPETTEAPVELSFSQVVKLLIGLQDKDNLAASLKTRIEEIELTITGARESLVREEQDFQKSREQKKQLLVEQKSLDVEIGKIDNDIAKNTASLQQVKTNDAYQALLKEIDGFKKKKDDLETKVLLIYEKIDQDKKQEQEFLKSFDVKKKEKNGEIAKLEAEKSAIEVSLQETQKLREEASSAVPKAVFERYEWLRSRRAGLALVPVLEGSSCGGCRMHVPQQVLNNILKARDFISCERCQRILYIQK